MSEHTRLRFDREYGSAAAAAGAGLLHLYTEVYAEAPYLEGPEQAARFAEQLPRLWTAPGFTLVRATDPAGDLVGVTYGFTMSPGEWFPDSSPAPAGILGGPKFMVMEWMVERRSRRRGIGRRLLADLLRDRREPWAALMANPAAPARDIYLRLGWRSIGTSSPPLFPPMDVLALQLSGGTGPGRR